MAKSDKIRVLIVDDIADTRDNLRKLLYFERDIEVVAGVGRGEEAILRATELQPDVVLMDINLPGIDGISAAEALRAQSPATQVIMMSVQGEREYLRRALLAGAREFLVKPFGSDELASTIRRVHLLARAPAPSPTAQINSASTQNEGQAEKKGEIIAVFGAKGGVGRTTVACNLAVALRTLTHKKVALVDGSLEFGDVGVFLNVRSGKTIANLSPHIGNLEIEILENMLVTHSSGVRVLLAPERPEMAELVNGEVMKVVLGKLREHYDYVIVDTLAGLQDSVLATFDLASRIVVLLTLEMPAIKNGKLFLQVASALGYGKDKVTLALNRVDNTAGIQVADVEESLRQSIPVRIVQDTRLATYAINRGVPFVISNPETALARGIGDFARLIAGMPLQGQATEEAGEGNNKTKTSLLGRLAMPTKIGPWRGEKPLSVSTTQ